MPPTAAAHPGTGNRRPDRRTRHREQTRSEILDHALQIMAEDGVAGLTMARLARAMDIRPPSLYKYYPSLLAVYDALFRRGQLAQRHRAAENQHRQCRQPGRAFARGRILFAHPA